MKRCRRWHIFSFLHGLGHRGSSGCLVRDDVAGAYPESRWLINVKFGFSHPRQLKLLKSHC